MVRASPFSTVPAHIYREWKEDFSISATEPEVKKAEDQQHWSPAPLRVGGLGGEGIRGLEYMSVFIGSNREIQTAFC